MESVQKKQTIAKTISVQLPSKRPSYPDRQNVQFLMDNYGNFKRSKQPDRIMYHQDGAWMDFHGEVLEKLRLGFSEGQPMVEVMVGGRRCLFDFYRMLQVDLSTGGQRSVAWIDVDGNCFFPTSFVDFSPEEGSEGNELKLEIEVRVNDDSNVNDNRKNNVVCIEGKEGNDEQSDDSSSNNRVKLGDKRKKEKAVNKEGEQSDGSSSNNKETKRQCVIVSDVGDPKWPNTKSVGNGDRCYELVKRFFLNGVRNVDRNANITSIFKCMRTGPAERARLEHFSKQMEITKRDRGASNTVFAWYGTSASGVRNILLHGFGVPDNRTGNESAGIGLYLFPVSLPQLSTFHLEADDNGEKHVILCRVILGNIERVDVACRRYVPSSIGFDTGVDDLMNTKRYFVYAANMNSHILPECVVSFKSSHAAVPNCFSMLEASLPPEKVQQLKALCSTYKDVDTRKGIFMEKLRAIVGDKLLLSTVLGMHGPK